MLRRARGEAPGRSGGRGLDAAREALRKGGVLVAAEHGLDLDALGQEVPVGDLVADERLGAGEADFLLKIVAETWDEYQKFLTTRLTSAPNVSHVKTMMVFRTAKALPGVPIAVE